MRRFRELIRGARECLVRSARQSRSNVILRPMHPVIQPNDDDSDGFSRVSHRDATRAHFARVSDAFQASADTRDFVAYWKARSIAAAESVADGSDGAPSSGALCKPTAMPLVTRYRRCDCHSREAGEG
jgi:hypothetical protein